MSSAPAREHVEPDNLTLADLRSIAPQSLRIENGRVTMGGVDLLELARKFETALYVYDEQLLHQRLARYRACFEKRSPGSGIIYAAKAFCCVAMDRIVAEEGCYMDVASGGELAVAKAAGFPMERIVAQGNNKSPEEIASYVDAGIAFFVVDSHEELQRISDCALKAGKRQAVVLRICPGIEADTHAYIQTANEDSKFGFNIRCGAAADAVRFALGLEGIELAGFHCHIGSQIFELSSYAEAARVMFAFMDEMRARFDFVARIYDMGGGLGIPYTVADEPSGIDDFAQVAAEALDACCARYDYPRPQLFVEPGRSVAANAGITLYTVGSVKTTPGICTYVAIDGGMTDNIRTALYGSKYEAFVVEHATEPRTVVCDIVGKHCESGDCVVKNAPLQPCEAGDTICVLATGAYCNEMASNYNKQVRPGIVFVADGKAREVVRRETYEDLLRRDVY